MAMARAAQAATFSRVSRSVEAKPQQPSASTRTPMPSDSTSPRTPTCPFLVERSRCRISITRASAKLAPRTRAVSSARFAHSSMTGSVQLVLVLRALGPGGQVLLLLRRELVELNAHGFELETRDLPV